MSLLSLPPELHQLITSHLPPLSLHTLSLTCRYFAVVVGRVPLSKQDTLRFRLHLERNDPARYHRVCSKCIRLRQFWHFSHKQASAKTKSDARRCLDCFLEEFNPVSKQRIRWFLNTIIATCPECSQLVRCVGAGGAHSTAKVVLPHVCRVGRMPEKLEGGKEPSVERIRDLLDRLEGRLPPRRLLVWRPDDPLDDVEETLAHLENCAVKHEALKGGGT